jgi:hypothetical protein
MAADGQKGNHNNFGLPNTTFKPIEPSKTSNWLKITAIIVLMVLIMGAGMFYWLFTRSSSSYHDFVSKNLKKLSTAIEEQPLQNSYTQGELDQTGSGLAHHAGRDNLTEFLPQEEVQTSQAIPSTKTRTIKEIDAPQGVYHVIIASYIDRDLAMDYGKKLLQKQAYVALIAPSKQKYFYRLAIEQGATEKEALAKAAVLKETYGSQLWVMKY